MRGRERKREDVKQRASVRESSEEYSLIMAVWRGEGLTGMNISLPALWSAAIRSITDGTDELWALYKVWCPIIFHHVLIGMHNTIKIKCDVMLCEKPQLSSVIYNKFAITP